MASFTRIGLSLLTTCLGAIGIATAATGNELPDRVMDGVIVSQQPGAPTETPPPPTTEPTQTPEADTETESTPTTETTQPVVRILSPQPSTIGEPNTILVIQYPTGSQTQVTVNGKPIDPNLPTQTQSNPDQNLVIQSWYGVPLQSGENTLTVQTLPDGTPVSVQVRVEQTALRLEVFPGQNSRIPADGRSTVTINGQILGENNQPIAQDAIVTLTSSAGKFIGADQDTDLAGFQVLATQGQFTAQLQSALEPQKVKVRAAVEELREAKQTGAELPTFITDAPVALDQPPIGVEDPKKTETLRPELKNLEAYTQVEFITNLRPSLVSGVINLRIGKAATDYYSSFREFLDPEDLDDGTEADFSASVFATGKVGQWLVTGAYNNQRPLNQTCDGETRLFRDTQFCDQLYPVYGDSSTVDYLTPSIDSVYLKLERTSPVENAETDYFMWGDYTTQEFSRPSQLFGATGRQLHGFKGNYSLGNLQATLLFANNIEGFQRDTILPNGTSGYYFLSRRRLVGGSESIFVEVEELNRPGTVIDRVALQRGGDYEIDYDEGRILFRRPLLATDYDIFGRTLVRRIVATYQFEGSGDTELYGGRLQYNFSRVFEQESWIAASYLVEDQGADDSELYGIDFLVPLGKDSRIVGEFARSTSNSIFRGDTSGSAYRLEMNSRLGTGILGRAYYRSVDEGFVNNATFSYNPGQTRYGGSLAARVARATQLQFQFDREINYGVSSLIRTDFDEYVTNPLTEAIPGNRVDNSLTTISAGVTQKIGNANLSLDYVNRTRDDRISGEFDEDSDQLVSRLAIPLAKKLIFRAQNDLNLGGNDRLYPDRTAFALDWAAFPGVTVRLAQQFFGKKSITSLDTLMDYRITENTSLTGRYSILNGANGMTGQGALGLNHRLKLAPGLRANLSYERIFGDVFGSTAAGDRFEQPYAFGQSASALGLSSGDSYSVGLEYTDNPAFKASARFERRNSSSGGDGTVISAAAAGKISPSLTALMRYQQANFANQTIRGIGDTADLKLGLAYRDISSDKFNALLRYEYRRNPDAIPESISFGDEGSREHVFGIEAIYAPTFRWEFYGKFALKSSRTSTSAANLIGTNTITLAQFRTTYRLGYNFDIAGEARWIDQSDTGFNEMGFAAEVGYYLTPDLRVGVGYSFGDVDDRDFRGRSEGGLYATFTVKLNELFDGFGIQKPLPRQQQESQVETVQQPNAPPTLAAGTWMTPANAEIPYYSGILEVFQPVTPPTEPQTEGGTTP
jgi:hypothetical protein